MEPILQIEHLSITFTQYSRGARRRELPVIRDLSLSLSPGEVTAVVGASGSGKSLLAHAILGLLPYNSRREGSILYKGQELTPRRLEKLRGREIALVPQGVTYLDPLMKVGPQLTQGRRDIDTRRRAQKALSRYGLGPGTERLYPFQLSGGMARRVLMASAVMESPQLIIADEPTPGLDAQAAGRLCCSSPTIWSWPSPWPTGWPCSTPGRPSRKPWPPTLKQALCGTPSPRLCGTPCPSGASGPFQGASPIPAR